MSARRVKFDDYSDTQLHVGSAHSTAPAVFAVCSRALSRASPAFEEILYGTGSRQDASAALLSENQLIELPHDEPASMAILLHAIHSQFRQIPTQLSVEALYDLVVVAHKYGATAALRPWTAPWTQSSTLKLEDSNENLLRAMSIYWILGFREEFFRTTKKFVESAPRLAKSDLLLLQTAPDTTGEHSQRAREMASQADYIGRAYSINATPDYRAALQCILLVVDEGPRWCRHATWLGPHRCESMILGSLMFCLSRAELWPLPKADDVEYSVLDLHARLDAVVLHVIGRTKGDPRDHQACNPSQHLRDAMKQVMSDVPSRILKITWIVALPESKPAPMKVFLNVAHANVSQIPHILSVENLYDLTVLTNYYDATLLLSPWIDVWMAAMSEISRDANAIQHRLLWISWEFGRAETFRTVAHRMLMEEPPRARNTNEDDDVQAPQIIESIDSIRIQAIQKLLHVVRDVTGRLTVADEGPRWCRHAAQVRHHQCEAMALGSITFCLARAGLWPLPAAAEVKLSLSDLGRVLAGMVIHDIGETTDEPRVDHGICNPRWLLMKQVEQVMCATVAALAAAEVDSFTPRVLDIYQVKLRKGMPSRSQYYLFAVHVLQSPFATSK
ncbi:hypothetical protein LLEC1_06484 [Akanthomyces lecanii]|uniref:BTB domain-containing protein n=1 Tax=Cordyceps confragosa TaxID=2714763 RepID=A0A179I6C1_CORDF|nr:hypothetical protein LLEC1_06484 [Akanthomyces lecanii]